MNGLQVYEVIDEERSIARVEINVYKSFFFVVLNAKYLSVNGI